MRKRDGMKGGRRKGGMRKRDGGRAKVGGGRRGDSDVRWRE